MRRQSPSRSGRIGTDWEGDERPGRSWNEAVIYEVHVRRVSPSGWRRSRSILPQSSVRYGVRGGDLVLVGDGRDCGGTAARASLRRSELPRRPGALGTPGAMTRFGFLAPHACRASGTRRRQVSEFKEMVEAIDNQISQGSGMVMMKAVFPEQGPFVVAWRIHQSQNHPQSSARCRCGAFGRDPTRTRRRLCLDRRAERHGASGGDHGGRKHQWTGGHQLRA